MNFDGPAKAPSSPAPVRKAPSHFAISSPVRSAVASGAPLGATGSAMSEPTPAPAPVKKVPSAAWAAR